MHADVESVLYSEKELADAVRKLADQINSDYKGKEMVVVGILKGSVVFLADLFRKLDTNCKLDFMSASSYGSSSVSSGGLRIGMDLSEDIAGKDVLIVEDILDTGNTLSKLKKMLLERGPASLRLCVLFDKPARRTADISAEYVGFTIEDHFIVGYGLDYDEKYRNLPYVGILRPEIYNS